MADRHEDQSVQEALDAFPEEKSSQQRCRGLNRAMLSRERSRESLTEFPPERPLLHLVAAEALAPARPRRRRRSRTSPFLAASLRRTQTFAGTALLTILIVVLAVSRDVRQSTHALLPSTMFTVWVPLALPAVASIDRAWFAAIEDPDPRDTMAVQRALNRYRDAFSILDVTALKAIWPSVDVDAVRKRFAGLHDQNFEFDTCRISVAAATANAFCRGSVSYVRKQNVKQRRTDLRQWQFTLANDGHRWTIQTAVEGAMDPR